MKLTLISPTSTIVMDINWLQVQTLQGNFTVKSGHAPTIVILAVNKEISIGLKDNSTTLMTIAGGILEINRNSATILLTHE